ncbi:hypothetical protein KL942_000092 [Ogataea angusta]|uniref:DUF2415 domain-containing protein n=1 Tax=Pichia angusta TaxID=870730 RepID=A0ABQ7S4C5_PICAN|nr:hypothetical protein KL943_001579 [Ogataea angusta]KAG7842996.1 hypothetical protein KL942_000092 [Ogataea angusta]KAG7852852.1 hypothetical protein KL940_000553 [Ogataea angusta]KAG7863401.1 hypothetical protein KL919_000716 [Ogataea angusta]
MSHWQLKDLVCAASNSNSVYFPSGNNLMSLDLSRKGNGGCTATKCLKCVTKFETSPRCLKEKDDLIAVGGVVSATPQGVTLGSCRGLFGLYTKVNDSVINKNVGTLINNCVSLYKISNSAYKTILCNNDHNMYLLDVTNYGLAQSQMNINVGVPLNHSSISPDSKSMIAVGDSSKVFVLHSDENMADIKGQQSISTNYLCGISTDWSSSGMQFSVCFQDGANLVYDIRRQDHALHEIHSTRLDASGDFRVCKFSGGTEDLLFISEHQGRVHVVDTRDYSKHQVILLPRVLHDSEASTYNQPIVKSVEEVCALDAAHLDQANSQSSGLRLGQRPPMRSILNDRANQPRRFQYDTSDDPAPRHIESPQQFIGEVTLDEDTVQYLDSSVEICGLDVSRVHDSSSLVIGSEEGLIHWGIDSWKRRCFPSFEMF